ncbi:MAG: arginine--tRNA ligase [Lachnospiraceae bacterium]|nr:arginine--tRNA ligase [Lachnospiraceae bacterium]
MKQTICNYLTKLLEGTTSDQIWGLLETPPDDAMGDFALPCFTFAKVLRKSPKLIAEELKTSLEADKEALGIARVEAVNGYCNMFLDRAAYVKQCLTVVSQENCGMKQPGKGKTICMDYSSPNIAKNFHVGHLRTTVIGNSLYKIYEKLGYRVVRINHLGDWGTQFGKLIVAYKRWSSKEAVEEKGIEELLRIYVKFNNEAEQDKDLLEEARSWFVKMEQNNEEALDIWNWFKEISMVEFERVYQLLGISFDSYLGESFYRDKVPALVEELKEKKLLEESQGANIISLEEYDMPPCLITKRDGGSIYHSRDIAAVLYRKKTYDFEKCLYVTGLEQTLHFKQVFTAIKVMGYEFADSLVHVPYGLVSLAGAKLSTRSGNIIYAEDILKEAMERAMAAIQSKNPELKNKEETAKMVGVGAVIFHDLFNQRIKNVDFNWEDVLSFEGTTGPYVQYTYARAKSILRKSEEEKKQSREEETGSTVKEQWADGKKKNLEYNLLTEDASYALVKTLAGYEEAVLGAAERYEPSVVARYIISVASAFNKFYHECPILSAEKEEKQARLVLVEAVQKVLKETCGLLGMECPEEM